MEDAQHVVMAQVTPGKFTLVWATAHAARKRHLVLPKSPNCRRRRSGALKGPKQEGERVLDLPIRVKNNPIIVGIAEANRQVEFERGTAGFVEDATLETGT
jgi:hypothetical protein